MISANPPILSFFYSRIHPSSHPYKLIIIQYKKPKKTQHKESNQIISIEIKITVTLSFPFLFILFLASPHLTSARRRHDLADVGVASHERRVPPAEREELVVRPPLDDVPLVEHHDLVGVAHCRQSVGNVE